MEDGGFMLHLNFCICSIYFTAKFPVAIYLNELKPPGIWKRPKVDADYAVLKVFVAQ